MPTVYNVPAQDLIDEVAEELKKSKNITPPEWASYVKTASFKQHAPKNKDWWFVRCASLLRKIYLNNMIGIQRLKSEYGGKRDRGSKPYHAISGSGSITRRALQQLETAGYVKKIKGKGRVLTSKGRSFLDNSANEASKKIADSYPELKKY